MGKRTRTAGGDGPGQLREISRGWVTYVPAEANDILTRHCYPGQRRISWPHVAFIADQMARGEFSCLGNEIVFATSEPGGERWLVDGQHRLRAIIRSDLPQRLHTLELSGPDSSIAEFYYHLDRGRLRNGLSDCVPTARIAEDMGVGTAFLSRCRSALKALCLGLTGEGAGHHKNRMAVRDTKTMLAVEQLYADTIRLARAEVFADNLRDSGVAASGTRLLSYPVLSIILGTLRYAPDRAVPFWREVAAASRARGAISRELADWLVSTLGRNDSDIRRRKTLGTATAWNDHVRGLRRSNFKSVVRDQPGRTVMDLSEWLAEGVIEETPLTPSMDVAADPALQEVIESGLPPAAANQNTGENK